MTSETPVAELDAMITRTPGVLGGKPCLRQHRVGVHRIAGWWKAGLSVEQIAERLSSLTPADIHVALAYYHLLHAEVLRAGEHHPGIIIGDQQTMSIGQELRRLLRINEAIPAAEMVDRLEFIANWAPRG